MNDDKDDGLFAKVVLLGESGVGKTSILNRYISNQFVENQPQTVGASFKKKVVNYNNQNIALSIWDTAGQEVYRTLTPMYFRDAQMALIVYSIDDPITFDAVKQWTDQVKSSSPDVLILICGNKNDIQDRKVSFEDGLKMAEELGLPYVETSAQNGNGIDLAFETLIEKYVSSISSHDKPQMKRVNTVDSVDIDTNNQQNNKDGKKKCC